MITNFPRLWTARRVTKRPLQQPLRQFITPTTTITSSTNVYHQRAPNHRPNGSISHPTPHLSTNKPPHRLHRLHRGKERRQLIDQPSQAQQRRSATALNGRIQGQYWRWWRVQRVLGHTGTKGGIREGTGHHGRTGEEAEVGFIGH